MGGVPPAPGANQVLMRGAVPWLFAGNQMTLAGNPTSVNPRDIPSTISLTWTKGGGPTIHIQSLYNVDFDKKLIKMGSIVLEIV